MHAEIIDSQAQPIDTYGAFKRSLTLAILANLVIGLALLIGPLQTVEFIGMETVHPSIWIRYIGLFMILLTLSYLPIRLMPSVYLPLAFYAVFLRVVFVIFFVSAGFLADSGFFWFALYDLAFGILLGRSLWQGYSDELMSRP